MNETGVTGLILIILNIGFSYKGFTDSAFFNRYRFDVDQVLIRKDYKRLITSGFLHVNWLHLIFNMLTLYVFSGQVESILGPFSFLIIYLASLIGGNLLALFVHRNHGDYSAVGASGAVNGIIFASIALFPGMEIGFFGLPFYIPVWIYALLYIIYSIYGIRSANDNIGHEAHLGGASIGMLAAILFRPEVLASNYVPILLVFLPATLFIYLLIKKPEIMFIEYRGFKRTRTYHNIDQAYNDEKIDKQKELDLLLDKINKKGIQSLSAKEKHQLEAYSKSLK